MDENKPNQKPHSESQTPPAEHHTEHHEQEHKSSGLKSKWPFLLIAILLLIVGIFGGYFVLGQTKNNSQTPTPAPDQVACTQEAKICPDGSSVGRTGPNCEFAKCPSTAPTSTTSSILEKTFTSKKLPQLSFMGYTLLYPSDWSLSEQRDESTSISTVTLTKDDYTLKIFQAATGGAGCIYEGDMPEGPASDYRNNKYKDLKTGFTTLRQTESPSSGKMSYNYCQKSETEDSYGQPTSVGHMSVSTQVANPDPEIVSEFEKIVKSIKTL